MTSCPNTSVDSESRRKENAVKLVVLWMTFQLMGKLAEQTQGVRHRKRLGRASSCVGGWRPPLPTSHSSHTVSLWETLKGDNLLFFYISETGSAHLGSWETLTYTMQACGRDQRVVMLSSRSHCFMVKHLNRPPEWTVVTFSLQRRIQFTSGLV